MRFTVQRVVTHIRHNEVRDTFADLMNEVCHDVQIEPKLQPLQGESFVNNSTTTEDEARLDIKANRIWGSRFSRAFFDVKIFKPHAKIAIHAAMVFPHLVLCKTNSEFDGSLSKTIARRLKHWQVGDLDGLYNERKALQMRLLKGSRRKTETEAQQFNKLMNTGKISSAIAKLTDTSKGVLSLDEMVKGKTVEQILIEKHPPSKPIDENYITPVSNKTIPFHPSIFDQINGLYQEGSHENARIAWTIWPRCK